MSSARPASPASALAVGALALLGLAPGAQAAPAERFPAAGPIVWSAIAVRQAPTTASPRVKVFPAFRSDYRPRVLLALGARTGADGRTWYRISVPGRPNGRTGWVLAAGIDAEPVKTEIVVDRSARRLDVIRSGKRVFRTTVAVGAPGMETPLGTFYVTAEFRPTDAFYGPWAFETSAYSRLTDWPGGGIVGIHGTSMPWLLGGAVSHGCVRVSNAAATRLHALVDPGTPVRVVD